MTPEEQKLYEGDRDALINAMVEHHAPHILVQQLTDMSDWAFEQGVKAAVEALKNYHSDNGPYRTAQHWADWLSNHFGMNGKLINRAIYNLT